MMVTEERAYKLALKYGIHETYLPCIRSSKWAYAWAHDIGNEEIMIDRITDSEWAYRCSPQLSSTIFD
jgi:hypothetical protein